MKEYLISNSNELIITENKNYIIEKNPHILVKSGVTTNIITYSKNDVNLNIDVEKDAMVNIYHVFDDNNDSTLVENIYQNEDGSNVSVMVVVINASDYKKESKVSIYHNANHTSSNFNTYVVAKDSSVVNLDNNAFIKKNAKNTNARQSTKALNLGKASILVNPNLYIDEYDVMASHGVAMGSINKDDLFYLMSRGLSKEEASSIVIMGFIEPILVAVENDSINEIIRNNFQKILQ